MSGPASACALLAPAWARACAAAAYVCAVRGENRFEKIGLARRQLVVLAEAIKDVGAHKYALHAHVEVNAHLVIVVRTVILDGVRVQGH